MAWKIEVSDNFTDQADLVQDIRDLGIGEIESVDYTRLYFLEGETQIKSGTSLSSSQIDLICSELLADNITQSYRFQPENLEGSDPGCRVEIRFKPGVTDSVGESVGKGIQDLEIAQDSSNSNLDDKSPVSAQTGRQYRFHFKPKRISNDAKREIIKTITARLLANDVIETFVISL